MNRTLLDIEAKLFCDFVQFDFVDSYLNITLDTMSAIKFALGWKWRPKMPDFLAIADDDVYLNIPAIWKSIYEDKVILRSSNFLLGELFVRYPIGKVSKEEKNLSFVENFHFPEYILDGVSKVLFIEEFKAVLTSFSLDCLARLLHGRILHSSVSDFGMSLWNCFGDSNHSSKRCIFDWICGQSLRF